MGRGKQSKKNNQPSTSKKAAKQTPKKEGAAPAEAPTEVIGIGESILKPLVHHAFWAVCEDALMDIEPVDFPEMKDHILWAIQEFVLEER